MSSIKSKLNSLTKRDIKIVQSGSNRNRVNSAAYEMKSKEDSVIFKAKSLTLTKPQIIPLRHEEAYIFEHQIAQADKEHEATSGIEPVPIPQESVMGITGPRPIYKHIDFNDFRFVFKSETENPEMLHIYARHLVTAEDAIGIFFSYDPVWNAEWKRFETYSNTHGLYWFWCNQTKKKKVVMVISCFKRDHGAAD